jgi:hypothetical protein
MKKKLAYYCIRATDVEYEEVDDDDNSCSCDGEDHYILAEQQGCECWCHGEESK